MNELLIIFVGGIVTISWFLFCYLIDLMMDWVSGTESENKGIIKVLVSGLNGILVLISIAIVILLFYAVGGIVTGEFFVGRIN